MISPFGHNGQTPSGTPFTLRTPPPIRLNPTDEVEALMGNPPRFIVRWGITMVALVVVSFAILGYCVKYPDVIEARVVLTTQNPPIRLVAATGGKINQFLVANGDLVDSGKVMAVLENTAKWQDVVTLEATLLRLRTSSTPLSIAVPETLQVGVLQSSYARLVQNWRDYAYFSAQNGVAAKTANLREQIARIDKLKKSLDQQRATLAREVDIAQNELQRNQRLFGQGVVSSADLEKSSVQYLQLTRQLENLKTQTLNNDIQQKQLEAQILDLSQSNRDNTSGKSLTLDADIDRLSAEIQDWKRTYLLVAPISGKVALTRIWSPQQHVNANEEVLTVVPVNAEQNGGTVVAKASLPIAGAGKVKTAQAVQIRVDGYPYQEYGSLEGQVGNIALVPQQDGYTLEIALTNDLRTTYGKNLAFRQEMQGTARIITEDKRVLTRIFDKITNVFYNR